MNEITPELIVELRELASKATPIPWEVGYLRNKDDIDSIGALGFYLDDETGMETEFVVLEIADAPDEVDAHANLDYAQAAANHLPALLDEIERLQAEITKYDDYIDRLLTEHDQARKHYENGNDYAEEKITNLQAEIIGEGKVLAQNEELMALCEALQARIAELNTEITRLLEENNRLLYNELQRIAELEAAQRWIPVSERLPDKEVDVFTWDGEYFYVGIYEGRSWCEWRTWETGEDIKPTHWRPLPAPPESEE